VIRCFKGEWTSALASGVSSSLTAPTQHYRILLNLEIPYQLGYFFLSKRHATHGPDSPANIGLRLSSKISRTFILDQSADIREFNKFHSSWVILSFSSRFPSNFYASSTITEFTFHRTSMSKTTIFKVLI